MSAQITEAHVLQFSNNVYTLSQQKGSKLENAVRKETINGKKKSFERVGAVSAQKKLGRHAPTPAMDTPHSRRWISMEDYQHNDFVDQTDLIRMLIDPSSDYAMAAVWAMGRTKDDVLIAAAFDDAEYGEEGKAFIAHPNSQKYAANNGAAFTNLNVKTLRALRRMFSTQEVDESIPKYLAVSSAQIEAMLGQTEVTSSDYNSVKALVQGDVNTFMGFNFISIERLLTTAGRTLAASATTGVVGAGASIAGANFKSCIAWAQDGLILGTGMEVKGRMDERPDLSYAKQIYTEMSIGATRMDEVKVIEVVCKED